MKKIMVSAMMASALVGCVNMPTRTVQTNSTEPQYAEIYRSAYAALQQGKWLTYKTLMRKVVDMSTASGAPPEKRAIYWYEYGRASGVVCDWEDAEFALTVASNLDAQTGGPAYEALYELGRLNVTRKNYQKAVDYFSRATKAFPQDQGKKITNQSASRLFEDFAYALEQTGGQQGDVKRLRDKAADTRENSSRKSDVDQGVTPYGTQCVPR